MRRDRHSHLRTCFFRPYRRGFGPVFVLQLWDAGTVAHTGQCQVSYVLTMIDHSHGAPKGTRTVLFDGADIGISPMHALDSDDAVLAVMGFLTLRQGDTDAEFFDDDTPEVSAFRSAHAEALACEVNARFENDAFDYADGAA